MLQLLAHSGADSIWHGGTVSRREANKELTKLYWASQKCSPKRLIVLVEPKKWRGTTKQIFRFRCFAPAVCPHFQIRSEATAHRCDKRQIFPRFRPI